jgi:3-oxoacyl-[acyl-carrier protein] reductase
MIPPTDSSTQESVLAEKTALVTGGSRGIGAAIARRFADLGADVAITYLRSEDAAEDVVAAAREKEVNAEAFQADATDPRAMTGLIPTVTNRLGKLDILVNNAGAFDLAPITDTTLDDYERIMNTNVRAVYLVSREAAKVMPEGGRIINVGSINADRSFAPGLTLYATSKAAVAGFTRALATELSERDITVNCVQPGPVDTDMSPDGEMADMLRGVTELGRFAEPDEIADLVAYLAGPSGSYITGATINIDGGIGT